MHWALNIYWQSVCLSTACLCIASATARQCCPLLEPTHLQCRKRQVSGFNGISSAHAWIFAIGPDRPTARAAECLLAKAPPGSHILQPAGLCTEVLTARQVSRRQHSSLGQQCPQVCWTSCSRAADASMHHGSRAIPAAAGSLMASSIATHIWCVQLALCTVCLCLQTTAHWLKMLRKSRLFLMCTAASLCMHAQQHRACRELLLTSS